MSLTVDAIQGFSNICLMPSFDAPAPSPPFHKELWELCLDPHPWTAIGAPRGHAKTGAVTHTFVLASVLSKYKSYVVIISNSESQAKDFLYGIKSELLENQFIQREFGIARLVKDSSTDIIFELDDGDQFRIVCYGSGQRIRGRRFKNKRPDLIIMDDAEDDEQVASQERRQKMEKWMTDAVIPSLSPSGKIIVIGTILHSDSLLMKLIDSPEWRSKIYKAHNEDFSEILWPERFPQEKLESIRRMYVDMGNPEGYSAEYLNNPVDPENALFRKQDFLPMSEEDHKKYKMYFAAADFAISQKQHADFTAMVVGGMDSEGVLHIVDFVHGRFDGTQIIDEMFIIQAKYKPEIFLIENDKVVLALEPEIERTMLKTNQIINLEKKAPTKDKVARARSIATRVRKHGVRFDKESDWYEALEADLLTVTPKGIKAKHDDRVDAFSWLGLAINEFYEAPSVQEIQEDEWEQEHQDYFNTGRCVSTGY